MAKLLPNHNYLLLNDNVHALELTFKVPTTIAADDIFIYLFINLSIAFFQIKKDFKFHVNRLADDSHEISSLIFPEKNTHTKIIMSSAAVVISALWV